MLNTPSGNLILTAAHCMAEGVDNWFVPGFNERAVPQDFWHIDAVYLDPRWMANQDPMADFAVARVSRDTGGSVRGGRPAGDSRRAPAPKPGTDVTVSGYGYGVGGGPIGCDGGHRPHCQRLSVTARVRDWWTGPAVPRGRRLTVIGIAGGLQGGGCQENISYSPPFDKAIERLLLGRARREAG